MSTRADSPEGNGPQRSAYTLFPTVYLAFVSYEEARDVQVMLVLGMVCISVSVSQSGCQCRATKLSPLAIVLSSQCLDGLHGIAAGSGFAEYKA